MQAIGKLLSRLHSMAEARLKPEIRSFPTIRLAGFQSINQESGLAQDVPSARTVG